ncbi:MAG: c-type cytochrome [Candidatus Longimicrobiales bacterium M2_2A_002]
MATAKLIERQCAACHGKTGRGDAAAAFQPKPADFSDPKFQDARKDAQLREIIASGKRVIDLNSEERRTLEAWARAGTTEQRYAERARYILAAAEGAATTEIARRFSVRPATVSKWPTRFARRRP